MAEHAVDPDRGVSARQADGRLILHLATDLPVAEACQILDALETIFPEATMGVSTAHGIPVLRGP